MHFPNRARRAESVPHPIFERLRGHEHLPSPKGVAIEVLRLARREDTNLHQIASAIQADPALTARLLKAVNCPALGVGRSIGSLQQAAMLLGLRAVMHLALGFSILEEHRQGRCSHFDYARFWSSSLGRAVSATRLARFLDDAVPEESFVSGLLSQIGRLALASVHPEIYAELLVQASTSEQGSVSQAEQQAFGISYAELSAEMMLDWGLPLETCEAVRLHMAPVELAAHRSIAQTQAGILHVAALVGELLAQRVSGKDLLTDVIHQAQRLGVEPLEFIDIFDMMAEDWRQAGRVFSIPTSEVPSLPELYCQANRAQRRWDGSAGADPSSAGLVTSGAPPRP